MRHSNIRPLRALPLFIALLSLCGLAAAEVPVETSAFLRVQASSGILIDADTGSVLWEKEADIPVPPASLTKLMTMHLALKAVSEGKLSLDQDIPVSAADCGANLGAGSSLMFLEPGMKVSLDELLKGMAVVSGNDAALTVARAIAGSPEEFARQMTAEAGVLGLRHTSFVEPSGLSGQNETTARDFATFCRLYLELHPEALSRYHSLESLSFPLPENLTPSMAHRARTIVQRNRNGLIFSYPGCDGFKTGYIDESGYNIALTAQRDGTRLLAVLLRGPGRNTAEGSRIREEDGKALLDWGFSTFVTLRPAIERLDPVRVWKGSHKLVPVQASGPIAFTARRDIASSVTWSVERRYGAIAPIAKGEPLGRIVFSADGRELASIPLVASEPLRRGNVFQVIWDSLSLWWHSIFGGKK